MSNKSHYRSANNNKSTTWVVVGVIAIMVVAVGALIAFSPPSAQSQNSLASDSVLTASERSYDFGTISMANGKVTKLFTVNNSTPASITVRKLYTSCMCTSAALVLGDRKVGPFGMEGMGDHEGHGGVIPTLSEELPAGQGAQVEVTFDPAAHGPAGVGPTVRNVFMETTDGKKLVFEFKAQVTP